MGDDGSRLVLWCTGRIHSFVTTGTTLAGSEGPRDRRHAGPSRADAIPSAMTRSLSVLAFVVVLVGGSARVAHAAIPGEAEINDYYNHLSNLQKAGFGPKFGMVQHAGSSGAKQLFDNGALYWQASTGVVEVTYDLWDKYEASGSESGVLGMPTDNVEGHPPCSYINDASSCTTTQAFQNGELVKAPHQTAIYMVYGTFFDVWVKNQRELGPLGLPLDDEVTHLRVLPGGFPTIDSAEQQFQGGEVSWSTTRQIFTGSPWAATIDKENTAHIRVTMPVTLGAAGFFCDKAVDKTIWVHDDPDGFRFEPVSGWCVKDSTNKLRAIFFAKLRVPSDGVIQLSKLNWGFLVVWAGVQSTTYTDNPNLAVLSLSAAPGHTDTLELNETLGNLDHNMQDTDLTLKNLEISDADIKFP
jgi:hypothetical protein